MMDFYELLGIKKDATESEIKSAYRQMAKKYHPDVNKEADANKIILSLNEAKETLLNKDKRKEYDLLLNDIKYSKTASKDKKETYHTKKEEYKETYSETYVTRWQFFVNYWKNGLDSIGIKILKSFLVSVNYLLFSIIRLISIFLIYLLYFLEDFINYFIGILLFIAFLSLLITSNQEGNLPFISSNVEKFLIFLMIAGGIAFFKNFMMKKSVNLLVLLQNLEDKIFIFVLMK